ncbi:tryptophanase leader peptide [Gynuella sunshinyii]
MHPRTNMPDWYTLDYKIAFFFPHI